MDAELYRFLTEIGMWMAIGAIVGLALRMLRPAWCRHWTKFVLNRQWKLFALGAIFFGAGTVFAWLDGNLYFAVLGSLLCVLEIVAMFRYGFKTLTPEMEERIDAS